MSVNMVNLNINPCKMCMPMGAVSALYGIRGCMSILHGSQGCATYIRRHMATHYNEPVDVASSSLTEQGTVFGGEVNLLKGLDNLIKLYHPEVIGVCTTCLAETIGEDTTAIIRKFYEANPNSDVKIVNVSSAGYAGTQNEGFFRALCAVVKQAEHDITPNGKINIITPMISPADTRWLKTFLSEMGIDYILLPDLSENLDGITARQYERLKMGGTSLANVGRMAGAKFTIEFSEFIGEGDSPAVYLNEQFDIPYKRLTLPCGIRGMDAFIETLQELSGNITESIAKERGRYLDAMVDSHKYCAKARAAVYGEPDFVKATVRLCCENGIVPVLTATGSVCKLLSSLEAQIKECADLQFVDDTKIIDDCDFETIELYCKTLNVNLMIGSSDGRRVAHKLGIPLIRAAFPIHDHVGGQRMRTLGFDGSLSILDQVANVMLTKTETSFRGEMFDKYYGGAQLPKIKPSAEDTRTAEHPCFGEHACHNARIHLPVAPKCNIQCNYCVRKFDCSNESRPGVTTKVLSPDEAFERYVYYKAKLENLKVVGIAGPGDALANFEQTKKTLELIRAYDPDVMFCISTNGLMLPVYAAQLYKLGVTHVTITVNAVDVEIGAKIYKYIDYMGTRYTGMTAAAILLANQLAGIQLLKDYGIVCKINCVALGGINDAHIFQVTKKAQELGAFIMNIMPHIPVEGSAFESLYRLNNKEIDMLREECCVNIKQMKHCRQCRADAIGILGDDLSANERQMLPPARSKTKLQRFAVATKSGAIVDLHFGHADEFYIYDSDGQDVRFIEKRQVSKYCSGVDACEDKDGKWPSLLRMVTDCNNVLALRIGYTPEKKLKEAGIGIIITYERVETAVRLAARESIKTKKEREGNGNT
ncbi:nitrogenase cofactor biosynthesis protein NifB [Lachnospiraceae bacterium ZAX-1]